MGKPQGRHGQDQDSKFRYKYKRNKSEMLFIFLIIVGASDPCLVLCYNAPSVRAQMFL